MSDEDDFDGEKTQFWLPGQDLPGHPGSGGAAAKKTGSPAQTDPDGGTKNPGQKTAGDAGGELSIDFDLSAEDAGDSGGEQSIDLDLTADDVGDAAGLDFDVTAENEVVPETLDFDISGDPKETDAGSNAAPGPVSPPPLDSRPASGGWVLTISLIVIASVVIYFVTR